MFYASILHENLLHVDRFHQSIKSSITFDVTGTASDALGPLLLHDGIIKWKNYPHYCAGNHRWIPLTKANKQRFLTPGHQGWNDLHSLCRIGMEYYLLNNDDNNIIYWIMMIIMIMMIIIMIIMMTMMIIGTSTIMIMIIIITTTLTMTIMKMIMIKTAQTPCQSLYKDRRI